MNTIAVPLLDQLFIVSTRRPGTAALRLTLHQEVTAAVLDMVDGRALLDLGQGRTLWATTRQPLTPGNTVTLRVQNITPQQISLRLIPQQQAESELLTLFDEAWVTDVLTSLSIPDDGTNRAIAAELMGQGLPVTPGTVAEVRAAWEGIGRAIGDQGLGVGTQPPAPDPQPPTAASPSPAPDPQPPVATSPSPATAPLPDVLPQVVKLVGMRLPVTTETVALAAMWAEEVPPWGEHTADLLSALTQALAVSAESNGHTGAVPPLLTQVLARVAAWPLQGNHAPPVIADQVRHLLESLGTSVERQLLKGEPPRPENEQPATSSRPADVAPKLAETSPSTIGEIARQAVEALGLPEMPDVPMAKLFSSGEDQILLHQVYKLAGRLSENPALTTTQRTAWHEVAQRVDTLLQHVQGEHLFNVRQPATPTSDSYYVFPLPLATPNGPQSGQMRIYWRGSNGEEPGTRPRVDPHDVRLLFRLDIPALGPLEVDLVVLQQRVRTHFRSDSESVRHLSRRHANELTAGLGRLGFAVEQFRASALSGTPEMGEDSPAMPRTDGVIRRVDMRA